LQPDFKFWCPSFSSTAPALSSYVHSENGHVLIDGGFTQNGAVYPHNSPHCIKSLPTGGSTGYKDGHVAWRKFIYMTPRTTSGQPFWW